MITTRLLSRLSQPPAANADAEYQRLLPVFERGQAISRNLFQICLQDGGQSDSGLLQSLPPNFQDAISRLRSLNPGWNYRLIGKEGAQAFILENYGEQVLAYYNRIDARYGAARADFLRYLLLYRLGGVYIDLKCGISRPLDQSIANPALFHVFFWDCFEGGNHHFAISGDIPEGEMLQGFIVSPAGHEFLREVIIQTMKNIDMYNPYTCGVGFGGVVTLAGPAMYTTTVYKCMKSKSDDCCVARPFADFGFSLYSAGSGTYVSGEYQRKLKMTDYRKLAVPIVHNCNTLLDAVNRCYLMLLNKVRSADNKVHCGE